MKPVQPIPQNRRQRREREIQKQNSEKLMLFELWVILAVAIVGFIALVIIAYWRVNQYSVRIMFVTGSALTFFTLLAIVFQAVVYRRQWNAMQDSLRQTEEVITKMQGQLVASEKQARVMEDSLIATQELVRHTEAGIKTAERNTRYSQRAYVTVTKRVGTINGFRLTIENSGYTPATDVSLQVATDIGFLNPKLPEDFKSRNYTYIGLLAPRDSYELLVPWGREATEEERPWLEDPQWECHRWCVGTIFYRDVFQTHIADFRQTDFAFYFDAVNQKMQAGIGGNEVQEKYMADENPN